MPRVISAFAQFFDSNGEPLSDGWLKFLYSGTNNTLKDTYTDVDQTIPNANPVQLDAEGRCPNVYGTGIYRVVLYADDPVLHVPGEMIQSFDPVQSEFVFIGANENFADWESTRDYQVGEIVIFDGRYYRSITADNGGNEPDSNPLDWEQIDFIRFWNTNVTYITDDIVVYGSVAYISLLDANIGNQPDTSPLWWLPFGSGTVLINWEEDGTTLRPVVAGYDLGDATNLVGTAYITDFGVFPETPASDPTNDYDVANKQYADNLSALAMHWQGEWSAGTYEQYDVVRDDNWTMIANTQTTDRPSPQPAGDPEWVRDSFSPPAFSEDSDTETALFIGQRYIFTPAFFVRSVRFYLPSTAVGLNLEVWAVYEPTVTPRFVNVYPSTVIDDALAGKWIEISVGTLFVEYDTTVDIIMVLRSPADEADFTYAWTYSKTNGDPAAGYIYHQSGSNIDQIRVHEQDNTLVDRTAYLDNIGPGSKILMVTESVEWDVLEASKTGDVYTFIVEPGARSNNGSSDFTFSYYGTSAIPFVYNTDLYLADARIRGYYGNIYDPDNATYLDDNGYGIDIQIQNALSSDEWDVVAQPPSGAAAGGSEGNLVYWQESEEYFEPVTTAVGYLGNTDKLIQGIYLGDSSPLYLGDAQDATIQFDGTDLAIVGTGDLLYNTNTVWHAGNDGTGSGLDADTLDGQEGSYYAVDADVVHLTGAESVAGIKTFTDYIQIGSSGDSVINFLDDTNSTYRTLRWDDSESDWRVEDSTGTSVKLWNASNDGAGSGLDADLLDGLNSSVGVTASTIMARDSNGDGYVRRFFVGIDGDGDAVIDFYDDTNDAYRALFWDASEEDWYAEDNTGAFNMLWHEGNDGTGSGLDADLLDGEHGTAFVHIAGTETITGDKDFTGALTINGVPVGALTNTTFRNKVINGNYDFWDYATSQATSGYGSANRWRFGHSGSSKTVSRGTFTEGQTDVPGNPKYYCSIDFTTGSGASNYVRMDQRIEGVQTLSGGNATLSFYAKADAAIDIATEFYQDFGTGGSSTVTAIGIETHSLTTSWQKFSVTIAIDSISGYTIGTTDFDDFLSMNFWLEAGSDWDARTDSLGNQSGVVDIARVQLEEGDVATDFEANDLAIEHLRCNRYYWIGYGNSINSGYRYAANVQGNLVGADGSFPVVMRDTPTMTIETAPTYNNCTLTDISGRPSGFLLRVDSTAAGYYRAYNGVYSADAEL